MHAVATTNAVIAGLIVIEAIKVLQHDIKSYRYDVILVPAYSIFCVSCSFLICPLFTEKDVEVVSLLCVKA